MEEDDGLIVILAQAGHRSSALPIGERSIRDRGILRRTKRDPASPRASTVAIGATTGIRDWSGLDFLRDRPAGRATRGNPNAESVCSTISKIGTVTDASLKAHPMPSS